MLVVGWWFASAYAFAFIAWQKVRKINRLLYNCDVENFLAVNQKIEQRERNKKRNEATLINLTSAHLMLGNYATAGQLLSDIRTESFQKTRIGAVNELIYHNNYFAYYINTGDLTSAAQALEQVERILQTRKLPKFYPEYCKDLHTRLQHLLKVESGNYDAAEELWFFAVVYAKNPRLVEKVSAKYVLGKIYLSQGQPDQAEKAFEYAVENGGSSIYRARAIEQLEALGKTDFPPAPKKPPVKVFSTAERVVLILYCCAVVLAAIVLSGIFLHDMGAGMAMPP